MKFLLLVVVLLLVWSREFSKHVQAEWYMCVFVVCMRELLGFSLAATAMHVFATSDWFLLLLFLAMVSKRHGWFTFDMMSDAVHTFLFLS